MRHLPHDTITKDFGGTTYHNGNELAKKMNALLPEYLSTQNTLGFCFALNDKGIKPITVEPVTNTVWLCEELAIHFVLEYDLEFKLKVLKEVARAGGSKIFEAFEVANQARKN